MRKQGNFLILVLVTIVVISAATYVQWGSDNTVTEGKPLFPGLIEKLDQATHARISKGESVTELQRQEEGAWRVRNRANYPADLAKVHELLLGTAGLERLEQKTRNPERYARLGLSEVADKGDDAMRILIRNEEGTSLADFFVGKRGGAKGRRAQDALYVRIQGDPMVWLVEGNLPYASETTDWLEGEILRLDKMRIRGARITHPDGEQVIVERDGRAAMDYRLIGLPEGAEPKSTYTINSVASEMAKLRLQDVRSAKEMDFSRGEPGVKVLLTTFDGMRITLENRRIGEDVFTRLDADFDAALIEPENDGSQQGKAHSKKGDAPGLIASGNNAENTHGDDVGKEKKIAKGEPSAEEPKTRDPASVKKEAATLSGQWRDWIYLLPKYRLNNLTRRMSDLTKEPTAKADAS